MVPDRLVVASHIREKLSLVGDFELGLGTRGEGLGQLDRSTTTFLVEGDRGINIDWGSEGLGIERGTTQSEIRRVEDEFRGILEDVETERGISGFGERLD